jgi:Tfp pilus assembly protein PilW
MSAFENCTFSVTAMTNDNKNTMQQVANKYCIYGYVVTIQLFYTKPTAYKSG